MHLLSPQIPEYELIDSGNFEKLERFGKYILARPEPQAVWDKSLDDADWKRQAHAIFQKSKGSEEKGEWLNLKNMPDRWAVKYQNLTLKLALSSFKHVGIFPEQAANWVYIQEKIKRMPVEKPKVLNLFAYTGVASLVAKASGADVTHVDSIKQTVWWAKDSMEQSGLDNIRWIVEDAMKFVRREVRRGNRYHGIILDPPAYGRGADGEKWVLEEGINELMKLCAELLEPEHHFFVLNLYSMGFSALIAENLTRMVFSKIANPEMGELFIPDSFHKKLPLGIFYRFASV